MSQSLNISQQIIRRLNISKLNISVFLGLESCWLKMSQNLTILEQNIKPTNDLIFHDWSIKKKAEHFKTEHFSIFETEKLSQTENATKSEHFPTKLYTN